jgi:hypothetical protein
VAREEKEKKREEEKKKKKKMHRQRKPAKLELGREAVRTQQLPLRTGVQARAVHDTESLILHPRAHKLVMKLDVARNIATFDQKLQESPGFPAIVDHTEPNPVHHLGGGPRSTPEDNVISFRPEGPKDGAAKNKPDVIEL